MQKLQSFHQELYQHALQATQHISAMNTTEIAEYSQDFYATLPSSFYNSDVHQLLKNVESAQFLIFGDFHTLPQSQRGFLNILIQVRRQYPARKLMVALEIFCANDQTSIDDFLNRKISEEDFLKKIDYLNKWGFPWDNYRHLVLFCKENSIRITGINSQFDTPNRLIRRDTYAADILNRWIENNPNDLCLCLIGEYHLADKHLIAHLNPLSRTIRVVNNVDEYYFRSSVLSVESTEYLELKKDFFCIQNSAPWVKWQSLAMWEELHSNGEGGLIDDCELYTEHHYDFDYQFLHILRSLNDFLKIELSSSELSLFELYIHPDQATLSHIKTKIKASRNEFAQLEQEAKINGYAYSSPSSTVIIMDPDITHFAEIAGFYLYDRLHPKTDGHQLDLFERIERQICGTIAAMIMNPRHVLQKSSKNSLSDSIRKKNDVMSLANCLYKDIIEHTIFDETNKNFWTDHDQEQKNMISTQTGEIIGSEIFKKIISKQECILEENLSITLKSNLHELVDRWFPMETMLSAS